MSTDTVSSRDSITKADFVAARELAYRCLAAVEELSFACGDISMFVTKSSLTPKKSAKVTLKTAISRIIEAINAIGNVLHSSGVLADANPLRDYNADWNGSKTPSVIGKIKEYLLAVPNGGVLRGCNTAHEQAYRLASDLWYAIECIVALTAPDVNTRYAFNSTYRLPAKLVRQAIEDVRGYVTQRCNLDFHAAKAEIERESAKALALWKRDGAESNVETGHDDGEPIAIEPDCPGNREAKKRRWLAEAMLLVRDYPDRSDADIARSVKKHPSTLTRSREYKLAASLARGSKADLLHGHIVVDSTTCLRDVEAVARPAATVDDKSDRGQAITGSRYFQEYCSECNEPMRVPEDKVGTNPVCEQCRT